VRTVQVVSVINYKGGVGKTTLTANLGAEFARRGLKVLLIDLDPQTNLTFCFYHPDDWRKTLRESLTIKRWFDSIEAGVPKIGLGELIVSPKPVNAVLANTSGSLDLIASHLGLIHVDLELARGLGRIDSPYEAELFRVRGALADALRDTAFTEYDLVLVDCPPNFNIATQTAIVASDFIVIPAKADYLSTLGIEYLWGNLEELKERHNEEARRYSRRARHSKIDPIVAGVIFTMIQFRNEQPISALKYYIDQVRNLGIPAFKTYLRENMTLFAGTVPRGVPTVLREGLSSQVSTELRQLATELLDTFRIERAAA